MKLAISSLLFASSSALFHSAQEVKRDFDGPLFDPCLAYR